MMTPKQLGDELKVAADNLARMVHVEVDTGTRHTADIRVCRYFIEHRYDHSIQDFWMEFRREWETPPRTDAGDIGQ